MSPVSVNFKFELLKDKKEAFVKFEFWRLFEMEINMNGQR